MSILCAIGLHKFKRLRVEGFTGEHDWFARAWGNALIVDACERCRKHRYNAAYLPSAHTAEGE